MPAFATRTSCVVGSAPGPKPSGSSRTSATVADSSGRPPIRRLPDVSTCALDRACGRVAQVPVEHEGGPDVVDGGRDERPQDHQPDRPSRVPRSAAPASPARGSERRRAGRWRTPTGSPGPRTPVPAARARRPGPGAGAVPSARPISRSATGTTNANFHGFGPPLPAGERAAEKIIPSAEDHRDLPRAQVRSCPQEHADAEEDREERHRGAERELHVDASALGVEHGQPQAQGQRGDPEQHDEPGGRRTA